MRSLAPIAIGAALLAGCNQPQPQQNQAAALEPSPAQQRLHELDATYLAIALKRAIYDSGYECSRIDKAGFVGDYKNLEMWMAQCSNGRNWAIFTGPDGSAQVRDCKDVVGFGLPKCVITEEPKPSKIG